MKTELPALAGQRETTYHEEKERADTDLEFSSMLPFLVLTCFLKGSILTTLHLGSNCSLYHLLLVFNFCLYLVPSSCQLTFKPKSSPYLCLMSKGGHLVVSHLCRRFGNPIFFLVIFNYHSHSPITGWPTTSALACS